MSIDIGRGKQPVLEKNARDGHTPCCKKKNDIPSRRLKITHLRRYRRCARWEKGAVTVSEPPSSLSPVSFERKERRNGKDASHSCTTRARAKEKPVRVAYKSRWSSENERGMLICPHSHLTDRWGPLLSLYLPKLPCFSLSLSLSRSLCAFNWRIRRVAKT